MRYVIVVVLLCAWVMVAEPKGYVLNYNRINTREISITCANGGDPTGYKTQDTLVISCGK